MKSDTYDLSGRVALVTGGAGLLGIQHSSALIESGATVYVADINDEAVQKACTELGDKAKPLHLDVTDADDDKDGDGFAKEYEEHCGSSDDDISSDGC